MSSIMAIKTFAGGRALGPLSAEAGIDGLH